MKDFVYNKLKISSLKRLRIPETRDLIKGIRLNRNERVENFEKNIFKKIFNKMNDFDLGKYSDQSDIYKVLSKYLKQKEENLVITSGIDGSIKSIFEIFADKGEEIGILNPTYAMYEVYGNIFKTKIIKIGYKNFKLQKEELYRIIKKGKIKILFLPNPNKPFEDNFSLNEIQKLLTLCKKKTLLL